MSLSRHDPTSEEFTLSLEELHSGSDRVAAIMGSAMVENELWQLLSVCLIEREDEDALLNDPRAPLGTFSARTLAAKAFGLIPAELAEELNVIRSIRNDFAHALLSINFDHPAVASRCLKLRERTPSPERAKWLGRRDITPLRERYESACWEATKMLLNLQSKALEKGVRELRRNLAVANLLSADSKT